MPARRSPRTELFALLLAATLAAGLGAAQPAVTVAATAPTSESVAAVAMDSGGTTTCAIRTDRTLWCWGSLVLDDTFLMVEAGPIGRNGVNEPQQIGRRLWLSVAVGTENVCGIVIPTATATSGSLYCFGGNAYGQLGVAPELMRAATEPLRIGTDSGWTSVDAANGTVCAINAATAWCIGRNDESQFGLFGDTANSSELLMLSTGEIPSQIATGNTHTCFVQADNGVAHCVGDNAYGQVGDGTTTDRDAWRTVDSNHRFTSLTAGLYFTCGIAAPTTTPSSNAGKALCWGRNAYGQLGSGVDAGVNSSTPVLASADLTFKSLRAGEDHVCGVTTSGQLWCWGSNYYGKAGVAGETTITAPHRIGTASNWAGVAAGAYGTCAYTVKTSRVPSTTSCWGDRQTVGNGTPVYANTPKKLPGSGWLDVAAGGSSRCAIQGATLPGRLYCWGGNGYGEIGDNSTEPRPSPYEVTTTGNWNEVEMGSGFTCGISGAGSLWCWGSNSNGQLGLGDTVSRLVPVQVGVATDWTDLALGANSVCGVRGSTSLWCWGSDDNGVVGNGAPSDIQDTPYEVFSVADGHTWKKVSFGGAHVCALDTAGALYCWGDNDGFTGALGGGALGDGTTINADSPVRSVRGMLFSDVSAGTETTCGINLEGTTYCWGSNMYGALGNGNAFPDWIFALTGGGINSASVAGANVALASGLWSSCAIRRGGDLWCWGLAYAGNLPIGTDTSGPVPRKAGSGFVSISMAPTLFGSIGGCGIKSDTTLWCWGSTYLNLLRSGWPDEYSVPQSTKIIYRKPVAEGGAQITGRAKKSSALTADAPSFTGTPLPTVSYQWYRCTKASTTQGSSVASGCTKITRATSSTYTLVTADVNKYVRLLITAKNKGGTVTIFTSSTAKVVN